MCFVSTCYRKKIRLLCCRLVYFTKISNFPRHLHTFIAVYYECSCFANLCSQLPCGVQIGLFLICRVGQWRVVRRQIYSVLEKLQHLGNFRTDTFHIYLNIELQQNLTLCKLLPGYHTSSKHCAVSGLANIFSPTEHQNTF